MGKSPFIDMHAKCLSCTLKWSWDLQSIRLLTPTSNNEWWTWVVLWPTIIINGSSIDSENTPQLLESGPNLSPVHAQKVAGVRCLMACHNLKALDLYTQSILDSPLGNGARKNQVSQIWRRRIRNLHLVCLSNRLNVDFQLFDSFRCLIYYWTEKCIRL